MIAHLKALVCRLQSAAFARSITSAQPFAHIPPRRNRPSGVDSKRSHIEYAKMEWTPPRASHFACTFAALAFLTVSCTTASTKMLDERTAIISGSGSGYNTMGDVTAKILQTAALEAQARGYPYFAILDTHDSTQSGVNISPTFTTGQSNGVVHCYGSSCTTSGYSAGTTYGGQAFSYSMPGADVTVRFFREGEVDPQANGVWSVASVLAANPKRH